MVYPALLEKEYILCMSERQILEGLKSQAVMGGHCLLLKTEFKKRSFPFFLSCFLVHISFNCISRSLPTFCYLTEFFLSNLENICFSVSMEKILLWRPQGKMEIANSLMM